MDLFKVNWIKQLYKSRWFPIVPQCIFLIVFLLIIYGALGITTSDETFAKTLRNTNLSNLVVWSYWWPLIIIAAVFFGRHWCTVCPMELVTSLMGKPGLKSSPGTLVKSGWIITLFYALILIFGVHTLAIHRIPHYMAIYMLILLVAAVVSALVYFGIFGVTIITWRIF